VVDEDDKVTGFNEKFVEMWRIPREVVPACCGAIFPFAAIWRFR
jgi:hypothetical protein